jgi:hypothetical protein
VITYLHGTIIYTEWYTSGMVTMALGESHRSFKKHQKATASRSRT